MRVWNEKLRHTVNILAVRHKNQQPRARHAAAGRTEVTSERLWRQCNLMTERTNLYPTSVHFVSVMHPEQGDVLTGSLVNRHSCLAAMPPTSHFIFCEAAPINIVVVPSNSRFGMLTCGKAAAALLRE